MDLLARLKAGHEDAFRQFVTPLREPLLRFIRKNVGSWQDAEDICQETFVALWQQRETIDTSKNISAFVFLIAKRKSCKFIQERNRRESFRAGVAIKEGSDVSPEDVVHFKELLLLVDYAIEQLPDRTRQIYRMYFYDGMSHEQISERLNISTINISSQLYQARKKIREAVLFMTTRLSPQNLIQ